MVPGYLNIPGRHKQAASPDKYGWPTFSPGLARGNNTSYEIRASTRVVIHRDCLILTNSTYGQRMYLGKNWGVEVRA